MLDVGPLLLQAGYRFTEAFLQNLSLRTQLRHLNILNHAAYF